MCGQDKQKLEYNDAKEHIHTDGCIDKLVDWIHSNLFILGGIALGLAIPQVEHHAKNTFRVKAPPSPHRLVVLSLSAAGWHPVVSDSNQSDQRSNRAAKLQRQASL